MKKVLGATAGLLILVGAVVPAGQSISAASWDWPKASVSAGSWDWPKASISASSWDWPK